MEWTFATILMTAILGLSVLKGMTRGMKYQLIRMGITFGSFATAMGLSAALKSSTGFSLGNYITLSEPVINSLTGLLPFTANIDTIMILSNMFFIGSVSMLLVVPLFLIINKIGSIFYRLFTGLSKMDDNLKARVKRKPFYGISLTSILLGAFFGLIQGVFYISLMYSPIVELVTKFI